MKGPKELKRYIAKLRRRHKKKNGNIPGYSFDDLTIFKLETGKKYYKRSKRIKEEW